MYKRFRLQLLTVAGWKDRCGDELFFKHAMHETATAFYLTIILLVCEPIVDPRY